MFTHVYRRSGFEQLISVYAPAYDIIALFFIFIFLNIFYIFFSPSEFTLNVNWHYVCTCHVPCVRNKWWLNYSLISSSSINPRQLWKNINILLIPALHSYDFLTLLCQSFANFFSDKIHKLHTSLLINRISTSHHFPPPFTPPNFSSFTCVTTDEVSKLPSQSPDTNCDLDHIPTSLLKQCSHISYSTSHYH